MLEFGNFNLKFFFPGPGRLVLKPLPTAILKTSLAFLFVLLYPLVNLLVADIVFKSSFSVVSTVGNTVFRNLNPLDRKSVV